MKSQKKKIQKERLDKVLVLQNLVPTRQKAQALILAGKVVVEDKRVDKAGHSVDINANIRLKGSGLKYVGRGALKLEAIVKKIDFDVKDLSCIDIGASTGGFTDFLLQNGAKKVYAVDVGYGQIAWKLRNDDRVINIERTNIRYMPFEKINEKLDLAVMDVSFISLKNVMPKVLEFLKNDAKIFALIKPQFEVGKEKVGKGGIVKDEKAVKETIDDLLDFFMELKLKSDCLMKSPILGTKGNQEFMIFLRRC